MRKPRPPRPPHPPKPTGPPAKLTLENLSGMLEARQWGLEVARDLADYIQGKIAWPEVDPGVLLYGAPGVGKTFYARALAGSCRVPLIVTSYSDWQRSGDGHLGSVLSAMHDVFEKAAKAAPCLLFIDEFDSFPTRRNTSRNDEWWVSVVNALLEKLDGFAGREGVIVVAACNDPSSIDPALLRAGRFDRKLFIPLPTAAELEGILKYHLPAVTRGIEDLPSVAILCSGMTGADVKKLVREASRIARRDRRDLAIDDVVAAIEGGHPPVGPEFMRRIATHEAGHAIAALRFNLTTEITVSVVNSGSAWGRTILRPEQAIHLTRDRIDVMLAMLLAGRAAEEVIIGTVSGGAGGSKDSDLASATRLATDSVTSYGLRQNGPLIWWGSHSVDNPILNDREIVDEVNAILTVAYERAVALIKQERRVVEAIATALMTKRALSHEALLKVVSESGMMTPRG